MWLRQGDPSLRSAEVYDFVAGGGRWVRLPDMISCRSRLQATSALCFAAGACVGKPTPRGTWGDYQGVRQQEDEMRSLQQEDGNRGSSVVYGVGKSERDGGRHRARPRKPRAGYGADLAVAMAAAM